LRELVLGTYDGIAGLFTEPCIGAHGEGVVEAVQSFAKGIVGTATKFFAGSSSKELADYCGAAMSHTLGCSFKVLRVEITKALGNKSRDAILIARKRGRST
jgi:hypothetical protein